MNKHIKRFLLVIGVITFLFFLSYKAGAQSNQVVGNGAPTAPVIFPGSSCIYTWVNDTPGIGLPASGVGNIASFIAVNNNVSGTVTATITAIPMPYTAKAYIADYNDSVSVINIGTNAVIDKVPVGVKPWGISVSPDQSRVYVTNSGTNTVSVIDAQNDKVIATVGVGANPHGIAVNPNGNFVYVANTGPSYTASGPNTVSVISTATNTVIATIPVGVDPLGVIISPDGSKVYVTNELSSTVSVIDTKTNSVITNISVGSVGSAPWGIAISPDGTKVYVANSGSGIISVINTVSNAVIGTTAVGGSPYGLSEGITGDALYITNAGAISLMVMNTASDIVGQVIPLGGSPSGVSVNPDGSDVYVANYNSKNVSVVSTATNTVTNSIPVGSAAYSIGNFVTANTICNSNTVTFTITVYPSNTVPVNIPNTFTPNNDGINDKWDVTNLVSYPNCTVTIFNRYGEKLFFSKNYPIPWDGKYNGRDVPAGTYYYIINLNNGSKPFSGWVAVIR